MPWLPCPRVQCCSGAREASLHRASFISQAGALGIVTSAATLKSGGRGDACAVVLAGRHLFRKHRYPKKGLGMVDALRSHRYRAATLQSRPATLSVLGRTCVSRRPAGPRSGGTPPERESLASGLFSPQWYTSGFPVVFSSGLLALLCCFASARFLF